MNNLRTQIDNRRFAHEVIFEPVTGIVATNVQDAIEIVLGSSAPSDAQYYVAAADSDLSNEVVVPAFIQTLLDDTTQGAAQATLGLVPGADVQAYSANLDLWSAETPTNYALLATLASNANGDGASLIGIEDSATLITATTVEGALAENRTAIDAIEADYLTSSDIGSTVQAYDADLDTWAGLTPSANFQTLVTQTFAQMRASLDLEAGTDFYSIAAADAAFQPLDSDLTAIAALANTNGNFIVGNGSAWVAESGNTARTSLGLGTGDSPTFTDITLSNDLLLSSGSILNFNSGDVTITHSSNQLALAGGNINFADNQAIRPRMLDYGIVVNILGDLGGGTDAINLESGNVVSATVSTSTQTFTFSNPPASGYEGKIVLYLTNGGSQTVNWPASVDWVGGTAPTLTASGLDILVFTTIDGGTTWFGNLVGLDYS